MKTIGRKLDFTFPVFFHTAILGNTPIGKHRAVQYLIQGYDPEMPEKEMEVSKSIIAGYITGTRPISESLTSRFLSLTPAERVEHIKSVSLIHPSDSVNGLVKLMADGNLSMATSDVAKYTDIAKSESADSFLAEMLTLSIKHRIRQKLSASEIEFLTELKHYSGFDAETTTAPDTSTDAGSGIHSGLEGGVALEDGTSFEDGTGLEDGVPVGQSSGNSSAPVENNLHSSNSQPANPQQYAVEGKRTIHSLPPVFSSYSFRELKYNADREEYRNRLLRLNLQRVIEPFSDDDILKSTDIFRRAEKTFVMDFTGTSLGLMEMLLHHISKEQCLQLVFIARAQSENSLPDLYKAIVSIIRFGLSPEGRVFMSTALEPPLSPGLFNIRIVYSIQDVPANVSKCLSLLNAQPEHEVLSPIPRYRGKVPDFLLLSNDP